MNYVTVKDAFKETVINKSRFLTFVYGDVDASDAARKIAELKKKYYDSTHVCYAYIADETGNEFRFSDDGEPSGTAGIPIYEAIKNGGYKKVLVAVVRYFGGIKLGAGGLVRAYGGCASEALDSAQKKIYVLSDIFEAFFNIGLYSKVGKAVTARGKIIEQQFDTEVKLVFALPQGNDCSFLRDVTSAQCRINKIKCDYVVYDGALE